VPPAYDFATIANQQDLDAKVSLRPGEFLFHEGDEADALYIVVRGAPSHRRCRRQGRSPRQRCRSSPEER